MSPATFAGSARLFAMTVGPRLCLFAAANRLSSSDPSPAIGTEVAHFFLLGGRTVAKKAAKKAAPKKAAKKKAAKKK